MKSSSDLSWDSNFSHIIKKPQGRLFTLNMLRLATCILICIMKIFCCKIRSVLEYACQLWQGGITQEQSDDLENMLIRACKIANPGLSYDKYISECSILSPKARRHSVRKQFFQKMQPPKDKLHRLLPAEKANTKNTRNCSKYPSTKTERYKGSFLPYALYNCQ